MADERPYCFCGRGMVLIWWPRRYWRCPKHTEQESAE